MEIVAVGLKQLFLLKDSPLTCQGCTHTRNDFPTVCCMYPRMGESFMCGDFFPIYRLYNNMSFIVDNTDIVKDPHR
jgi:hypothetical protein